LVDISHYLFKDTRDKGWSASYFNVVLSLFQHWRVISERMNGPNNKPLEHVARAGHILDDVKRFGHSNGYWCFPHEREVQKYQNICTNNKGVEKTFIIFYLRKLFQQTQLDIGMEEDCLNILERALAKVHNHLLSPQTFPQDSSVEGHIICHPHHEQCVLHCASIGMATKLTRLLKKLSNSHCAKAMINKGILVHTMSSENVLKLEKADAQVNEYLRDYYDTMDSEEFYVSTVG
jgi:hypothetical protein